MQSSRLEDQRSSLPGEGCAAVVLPPVAPTVPDDDFFALIMRFQAAGRLDDQRSALPTYNNNNNASPNANTGLRLEDGDVIMGPDGLPVVVGERAELEVVPDPRSLATHRGSGVVVPTGGLTKAILDRLRSTRGGEGASSCEGASYDPASDPPATAPGVGTKEKLMNRLKNRK